MDFMQREPEAGPEIIRILEKELKDARERILQLEQDATLRERRAVDPGSLEGAYQTTSERDEFAEKRGGLKPEIPGIEGREQEIKPPSSTSSEEVVVVAQEGIQQLSDTLTALEYYEKLLYPDRGSQMSDCSSDEDQDMEEEIQSEGSEGDDEISFKRSDEVNAIQVKLINLEHEFTESSLRFLERHAQYKKELHKLKMDGEGEVWGLKDFIPFCQGILDESPIGVHHRIRPVCHVDDVDALIDFLHKSSEVLDEARGLYVPGGHSRVYWYDSWSEYGLLLIPQLVYNIEEKKCSSSPEFQGNIGRVVELFYNIDRQIVWAGRYQCHDTRKVNPAGCMDDYIRGKAASALANVSFIPQHPPGYGEAPVYEILRPCYRKLYKDGLLPVSCLALEYLGHDDAVADALENFGDSVAKKKGVVRKATDTTRTGLEPPTKKRRA